MLIPSPRFNVLFPETEDTGQCLAEQRAEEHISLACMNFLHGNAHLFHDVCLLYTSKMCIRDSDYGVPSYSLLVAFNFYRVLGGIGVGLASAICPMYKIGRAHV